MILYNQRNIFKKILAVWLKCDVIINVCIFNAGDVWESDKDLNYSVCITGERPRVSVCDNRSKRVFYRVTKENPCCFNCEGFSII